MVYSGKLSIIEKKKKRVESIGMSFPAMFVRIERRERVRVRK